MSEDTDPQDALTTLDDYHVLFADISMQNMHADDAYEAFEERVENIRTAYHEARGIGPGIGPGIAVRSLITRFGRKAAALIGLPALGAVTADPGIVTRLLQFLGIGG